MPRIPADKNINPQGPPSAGHPKEHMSGNDAESVKQVSLAKAIPENKIRKEQSEELGRRRVKPVGHYTGDAIPNAQHDFRKALNRLNQTCSGLMFMQMMQLRGGLVGLPGLYYQPGGRPPISIDATGSNLPGNAQNQLYQHENAFIQQPSRAFTALNRQLAATQHQVQSTVNILATMGLQAGMRQPQLVNLLPVVSQPQAIALGAFPGIYSSVGPLGTPWLPNGFTASFNAAASQKPVAFAQFWVPGIPAPVTIPTSRGFYFMPEAPREDSVFQGPFSPYSAWRRWCEKSDQQPLSVLYPGLEYEGDRDVELERLSAHKPADRPLVREPDKPVDYIETEDSLDALDDIGTHAGNKALSPTDSLRTKDDQKKKLHEEPVIPPAKKPVSPKAVDTAPVQDNQKTLALLKRNLEEKGEILEALQEKVIEMESQLQIVEDSSLMPQEQYEEQIAELSNNESQLRDFLQVMINEIAQNEAELEAVRQADNNKEADVSLLFKKLDDETVVIDGLMSRVDVVSARLKERKKLIAIVLDSTVSEASVENGTEDVTIREEVVITPEKQSVDGLAGNMNIGFPNRGNTCFANGSLKAVLAAYPESYYTELWQQADKISDERKPVLIAFLNLVGIVNARDDSNVNNALKTLFDACTACEVKDEKTGKVVSRPFLNIFDGNQHDAAQFILPLMEILGISGNPAFCLKEIDVKEFTAGKSLEFTDRWVKDSYISPLLNLPLLRDKKQYLQSVLKNYSKAEKLTDFRFDPDNYTDRSLEFTKGNTQDLAQHMQLAQRGTLMRGQELVTKRKLLFAADTNKLSQIGIQVGLFTPFDLDVKLKNEAKELLKPENDYLEIPITDIYSGENVILKFRRKSICLHTGSSLSSGHYTAAVKYEKDGQERWQHHNDASVSNIGHPSKEYLGEPYLMFYERVWDE